MPQTVIFSSENYLVRCDQHQPKNRMLFKCRPQVEVSQIYAGGAHMKKNGWPGTSVVKYRLDIEKFGPGPFKPAISAYFRHPRFSSMSFS